MILLTTWLDFTGNVSGHWSWWTSGIAISLVMFFLMYFGKNFGVSDNLRTMCASMGGGKFAPFFKYDWKQGSWNLVFVLGSAIGGFIAINYLMVDPAVEIHPDIVKELKGYGLENAGKELIPMDIYAWDNIFTLRSFVFLVLGGFLVGFGARYAGGCTSGHAISGLSNLQPASLVAVIGFFIGGLIMTWLFLPYLLQL